MTWKRTGLAALIACAICAPEPTSATASQPVPDPARQQELHGIAASCAAFYHAAMIELELPVDANEPKRQDYLAVTDALSEALLDAGDRDAWFEENVVRRMSTVATLIQLRPDEVTPKVLENLGKCDALLPEMKSAAGLD